MKIKTYKGFNEGKDYNLSVINDMLLDFTDKDVDVRVTDGSWILDNKSVEYVKISIGRPQHRPFTVESCIFDVIDYLKGCGLVLMEESWFWYGGWQHYVGCPNCLSDDFEDNYGLRGTTRCNKCEYIGPPDRFLLSQWPVTQKRLEISISEGKKIEQIELLFSGIKSLYKAGINESFSQGEVDEIKSTVSDMLLELQFDDIRGYVWVLSDKMVQLELRKRVKDKSSAVLWGDSDENRSFEWSDVEVVVDGISEYLSGWGFVPYSEVPKFEVRANWEGSDSTDLAGYDTCLYLRWKKN
jgi:isopentenyldiphosphate isomerase